MYRASWVAERSLHDGATHDQLLPRLVVIALALIVVTSALYGAVKFTSTWAAPDAGKVSFKGQKVAALIMSDDMNLRVPAEEALARELTAKGMTGVAAFRLIPREELKDVSRAKGWFERGSVAGVVVLRPVSDDKVTEHTPDVWTTSSYSTLWGYFPYGWSTAYSLRVDPGRTNHRRRGANLQDLDGRPRVGRRQRGHQPEEPPAARRRHRQRGRQQDPTAVQVKSESSN